MKTNLITNKGTPYENPESLKTHLNFKNLKTSAHGVEQSTEWLFRLFRLFAKKLNFSSGLARVPGHPGAPPPTHLRLRRCVARPLVLGCYRDIVCSLTVSPGNFEVAFEGIWISLGK
jgi:hypothetical protein